MLASIFAVLVVATIGASLALQGWKSRIPAFDLLLSTNGADELVAYNRIPDRGAVSSYGSHNPPGGAWLMSPGVFLFTDPRLFEYVGSVTLYVGTLIGIFLLARTYFGMPCAILSVALYGLSQLGLYVASSVWERLPLHFFYVWMVYWTAQWVRKRDARYLAAAVVTWASGMYVFMEIAPAFLILPVIWLIYRPPLKLRPLLYAGILILVIWYPYLQFQSTRNFADLKSQLLRQRILPAKYNESWCDQSLILRNSEGTPNMPNFESDQNPNVAQNLRSKTLARLTPVFDRANLLVDALFSNFEKGTAIPGSRPLLVVLFFLGLLVLSMPGSSNAAAKSLDHRAFWKHWLPRFAVGMILASLLANELIIARYLSLDGVLERSTVSSIRWSQLFLILSGITLLIARSSAAAVLNRFAMLVRAGVQTTQRPENTRFIVLSFLVPWLILILTVENASRLERFWWLWPLQIVILAAIVTYVASRLRAPRMVTSIGSAFVSIVILCNPLLLSRVEAWWSTGWTGPDAEQVQVVDYVASRLEDRNEAAIGYQIFIWRFMAVFNVADPRYKVGADFDLLLWHRHGVSNTNHCAEGVSPDDEFRIVQITPTSADPEGASTFDISLGRRFRLLQQFGSYQVFKRGDLVEDAASFDA